MPCRLAGAFGVRHRAGLSAFDDLRQATGVEPDADGSEEPVTKVNQRMSRVDRPDVELRVELRLLIIMICREPIERNIRPSTEATSQMMNGAPA